MSSEPTDRRSLLGRYRNAGEIFDDQVLAKPTGEVFHRLDPDAEDPRPACHACRDEDKAELSSPESVHQAGLSPCRVCYQAIFEYLATQPESPVKLRSLVPSEEIPSEISNNFEPVESNPKPAPLTALTEEVMVTGGSSKVMHAPTPEGPFCGQIGDYRKVDCTVVQGHYRPCRECFTGLTDDKVV